MVMATSLGAAAALFSVFFGGLAVAPTGRRARVVGALAAAGAAGMAWAVVVWLARTSGVVRTEEAQFHHLYILAVVGLPAVGVVLLISSIVRPANDRRARHGGRLIAVAFVLPAFVGVYATNIEPGWLQLQEFVVGEGGVRIGVVADVQTDAFGDFEDHVVEMVNSERPDLIVVPGDITQVPIVEYDEIAQDAASSLSALTADGGVYIVSGNTDPSPISIAELANDAGLTALDDAVADIDIDGQHVRLLGLSWPNNQRVGVAEAINEFIAGSTDDSIDIVLAHSPDVVLNFGSANGIDLVIAGHTHGGQIQIPFWGPVWNVTELPRGVAAGGLHEIRGVPVYVSPGIGVQRGESPKIRFGVRPTVAILDVG